SAVQAAELWYEVLPTGVEVAFCTSCLARGYQLRTALLCNLIIALPNVLFGNARFYVAVFEDERGECADVLADLFEGPAACALRQGLVVGVAKEKYFHASVCKNTAHAMALEGASSSGLEFEKLVLVNLDADNLISPKFLQTLASGVTMYGAKTRYLMILWKGSSSGVGGRIAYTAAAFAECGGYDEALLPSGYQDFDLRDRLWEYQKRVFGIRFSRTVKDVEDVAIPNDPTSVVIDR
ncbi:MAG: hypothetical protein GY772_19330, partial [bacterium]|nr:hypothetical protein [bacterium]